MSSFSRRRNSASLSENSSKSRPSITNVYNGGALFKRRGMQQSKDQKVSQKTNLLDKIRNRENHSEVDVTPELAARVIKEYLLPMFEADTRNVHAKNRAHQFGISPREDSEYKVNESNLLSERLMAELTKTQEELDGVIEKWQAAEEQKECIKSEVEELKIQLLNETSNLNIFQFAQKATAKNQQDAELGLTMTNMQLKEHKEQYAQCETQKKEYAKQLYKEKATNEKLKYKATQLQHGNSLLKLENDIMGERLKGLYIACDNVSGPRMLEDRLQEEIDLIKKYMNELIYFEEQTILELDEALNEKDRLIEENYLTSKIRDDIKEEVKKLKVTTKDRIERLKKELDQATEEKEQLTLEHNKMEKRYKDLSEEHEKTRKKLKQIKQKRINQGEPEEKFCKNCQRTYLESENYNWSCRMHSGTYSGEMYWCCGKTEPDAPGCKIRKHESRDDEDEEEEDKEKDFSSTGALICSSCKELGHSASDCPRDPNARTKENMADEIERMNKAKDKKKSTLFGMAIGQKLLGLLGIKLQKDQPEGLPPENDKVRKSRAFEDIVDLKNDFEFPVDNNLYKIKELISKEMEKEEQQVSKTKNLRSSVSNDPPRTPNLMQGLGSILFKPKEQKTEQTSFINTEQSEPTLATEPRPFLSLIAKKDK